jgi:hypothetical protein
MSLACRDGGSGQISWRVIVASSLGARLDRIVAPSRGRGSMFQGDGTKSRIAEWTSSIDPFSDARLVSRFAMEALSEYFLHWVHRHWVSRVAFQLQRSWSDCSRRGCCCWGGASWGTTVGCSGALAVRPFGTAFACTGSASVGLPPLPAPLPAGIGTGGASTRRIGAPKPVTAFICRVRPAFITKWRFCGNQTVIPLL